MNQRIEFRVGDLVSRDGTDTQRVVEIGDGGDLIHVECVKEPLGYLEDDGSRAQPWCRIGDREWNLARRYEFAGELAEIVANTDARLASCSGSAFDSESS